MLRNVVISVGLHAVLVVVAYYGLPSFRNAVELQDLPMTVELVTVSDTTNLPTKPKETPKPTPPKPQKAPPPPPKAPPQPPAPPPGPQGSTEDMPAPAPEPAEERVAVIAPPEPKPRKDAKPKPKPEPEPKPEKPAAKPRTAAPLPPRKPTPPDSFQSVLRTLENLKPQPQQPKPEDKPKPQEPDFSSMMENALESDKQRIDIGPDLTISEIDLVRQQIQRCWAVPAGAKGAHEMQVTLHLVMNPDGTIQSARIDNSARMNSDPFFRTMGESIIRAVSKPGCTKLRLPPEKYERWKTLTLDFDPKEMYGL